MDIKWDYISIRIPPLQFINCPAVSVLRLSLCQVRIRFAPPGAALLRSSRHLASFLISPLAIFLPNIILIAVSIGVLYVFHYNRSQECLLALLLIPSPPHTYCTLLGSIVTSGPWRIHLPLLSATSLEFTLYAICFETHQLFETALEVEHICTLETCQLLLLQTRNAIRRLIYVIWSDM